MESSASQLHSHSGATAALRERPTLELISHTSEGSCLTLNDNYDMWDAMWCPNLFGGFDTSLTSITTPHVRVARLSQRKLQSKEQQSHTVTAPSSLSEETLSETDLEMVLWHRPPRQAVIAPRAATGFEPTIPGAKVAHSSNGGNAGVEEVSSKKGSRG
ncbi:hypothetical protein LSCM4_03154 [Leishmania orientalis]|uniref:Uncharacterized protein n=1 Tax=Leishmania orientalis TaxID=2249476 RepID=A0A836KI62_9TRYP|nr:hypothetical protein LSCM4_03154 [Leishmania orientalis]